MSDFFDNCTEHSKWEIYFLNCTETTNQCNLMQGIDTISEILAWFNLRIPLLFFAIAFILNAFFASILFPEFRLMNDTTRKQYVFIVSRCISSLSASFAMLTLRLIQFINFSFGLYLFFFIVDDLSFYSLLSSYVGSAILLYLATVRPIYYSLRVSVNSIYTFAAVNWIGSIILAVTTAIFQAAMVSEGPFNCDMQHCQPILNIVMFVIILLSFLIPIFTLTFVLITLYRYKVRAESIGTFATASPSSSRSARTRLAWTLFTFTLLSLTEAIPSSVLVGYNVGQNLFTCEMFYQADHLQFAAVMVSLQTLAWSLALVVDPLSGLLFDPRIRRVWVQQSASLKSLLQKACTRQETEKSAPEENY